MGNGGHPRTLYARTHCVHLPVLIVTEYSKMTTPSVSEDATHTAGSLAPLDYASWLGALRGVSASSLEDAVRQLSENDSLDYACVKRSLRLVLNNAALLEVDADSKRGLHTFTFPRCDVVADIASNDPRVALAITLGGAEVCEGDPLLLIAAQYHEARARMSFEHADLTTGRLESVGLSYTELVFQRKHRVVLSNAHVVAGSTSYQKGVALVSHSPMGCPFIPSLL